MTNAETNSAAPETVYREGLAAGRLRYQRCADCANSAFPPRTLCPGCGSTRLSWADSTGLGIVYSTTVVRSRSGEHNVILVDLDEGFRMMSRVDDVPPAEVRIGARVRCVVVEQEATPVAVFREGRS